MVEANRLTSDLILEVIAENEDDGDTEGPTERMQLDAPESTIFTIAPNPDGLGDYVIDDPVTGAGNEDLWIKDEPGCADGTGEEGCAPP